MLGGGSKWQVESRAGDLMGRRAGVGGCGCSGRGRQAGGQRQANMRVVGQVGGPWAGGWAGTGGRAGGWVDGLVACVLSLVWWP